MNTRKTKLLFGIFLMVSPILLISQDVLTAPPQDVKDGAYIKSHNSQKESAYTYPDISEKDIVWSKTIWREIDLREKINHQLYYPAIENRRDLNFENLSLIDVILEVVQHTENYFGKGNESEWMVNYQGEPYIGYPLDDQGNPQKDKPLVEHLNFSKDGKIKEKIKSSVMRGPNEPDEVQDVVCPYSLGVSPTRFRIFDIPNNARPGKEFEYGLMNQNAINAIGTQSSGFDNGPSLKAYDVIDKSSLISPDSDDLLIEIDPVTNEVLIDSQLVYRLGGTNDTEVEFDNNPYLIDGASVYQKEILEDFKRVTVTKWRIKEEWFFDKKRSVLDVRIIGLCPVSVDPNRNPVEQELFWIYYPDWRDVLAKTKVQNYTKNNAQQRSYLGIFEKRMFSSRIIQESNIMNRKISDYMIGLDAVLESERIKEEIFNLEHDMWEY